MTVCTKKEFLSIPQSYLCVRGTSQSRPPVSIETDGQNGSVLAEVSSFFELEPSETYHMGSSNVRDWHSQRTAPHVRHPLCNIRDTKKL